MPRRAGLALPFLVACAAVLSAQSLSGALVVRRAAEAPAISNRCVILLPPDPSQGFEPAYRFAGSPSWTSFDVPLELDAAYGEDRSYALELRDDPSGDSRGFSIRIDRLPPGAPAFEPAEGLHRSEVRLGMTAEPGAVIRYSISTAGSEAGPFADYDPDNRPSLEPPAVGSATCVVLAYAVDEAGNASVVARATYRLAAPGPEYEAPPVAVPLPPSRTGELPELAMPAITRVSGHVALDFRHPEGSILYVAISPASVPSSLADFLPLPGEANSTRLDFPSPPGWTGREAIYVGLLAGGSFVFRTVPMELALGGKTALAAPAAPKLLASVPGGPAWLAFPSYQGEILYSLDGSEYALYGGPIALPAGMDAVVVSWHGRSYAGEESATTSLSLSRPLSPPVLSLVGPEWDAILDHDVELRASGKGVLRYESRSDGSIPPEPGASSPLAPASISVSCPAGEEKAFVFRYRGFSGEGPDAVGGEGGILRFRIDRKPPLPPTIVAPALSYSSTPLSVSFMAPEGKIMAAVGTDGEPGDFEAAPALLELKGSADGPVTYHIRAYAVDAAGNRSAEAAQVDLTVDVATVYVSEDGSDSGDGTRERPLASLDAAIALALGSGGQRRTALAVRGRVACEAPIELGAGTSLSLKGGFDASWGPQPGGVSVIVRGDADGPLFSLSDSSLRIEGLAIEAAELRNPILFSISGSELTIRGSSVAASSDGDVLLVDAAGSRITLVDSAVSMEGAVSACVIQARDCVIHVEGSRLAAGAGVRYFSGINASGGSLSLGASAFSSRAVLGSRLVALSSGSLDIVSSYFDVRGAAGFLSIGSFDNCTGRVIGCKGYLEWGGGATLFRLKDSSPAFIHDTFIASTAKGSIRFFDCAGTGPVVRNCILGARGSRNELIASDRKPLAGEIAANCLWGFSTYVTGALAVRDLAVLNAYNAADASSRPNLVEAPAVTFAEPPPASFALAEGSACRGAGMALPPGASGWDGAGQGGAAPDIGADQSD